MIEKYEKWCSVAFTGHRFISSDRVEEVRESVSNEIRLLYFKGFRNFFCGMALGFDMLAAEEVLKLKEELPGILLVATVPYREQNERWGANQKKRYLKILEKVDDVIVLSEHYYNGCFLKRNDFMLNHVAALLAYFDGANGRNFLYCKECKAVELANLQPVLMVVFWIGIAKKVMPILYI